MIITISYITLVISISQSASRSFNVFIVTTSVTEGGIIILILQIANGGTERLSDLLKVKQEECKTGTWHN